MRVHTKVPTRASTDPAKILLEARSSHTSRNLSTALGDGSAATNAPLIAPTDVPTITSGRTWRSNRACSIPTSAAPSTPPPPRTNAVPPRSAGTRGDGMGRIVPSAATPAGPPAGPQPQWGPRITAGSQGLVAALPGSGSGEALSRSRCTFVTDGVRSAIDQARALAGDRDFSIAPGGVGGPAHP